MFWAILTRMNPVKRHFPKPLWSFQFHYDSWLPLTDANARNTHLRCTINFRHHIQLEHKNERKFDKKYFMLSMIDSKNLHALTNYSSYRRKNHILLTITKHNYFVFMKTTLYKIDVVLYQMFTRKYAFYIY